MASADEPVIGPGSRPAPGAGSANAPSGGARGGLDLSWAVLLARWTDVARAAVALPKDAAGARWRASVAPAIGLQAVTFALADLGALKPEDVPAALDRAALVIDKHEAELRRAWEGVEMHHELSAMIDDARAALRAALAR